MRDVIFITNVLVAMYISFPLCTGSEVKIILLLLSLEYQKSGTYGRGGKF
jgi:hypothetical protein